MKRKYDFIRFFRRLPEVLAYLMALERLLRILRLFGELIEVLLEYLQDFIG